MDLGQWLNELDLGEYTDLFVEHGMTLEGLADLDDERLKVMGVSLLGHRRRILIATEKLKATTRDVATSKPPEPASIQGSPRESVEAADSQTAADGAPEPPTDPTFVQPNLAVDDDILPVEAPPSRASRLWWWIGGGILVLLLVGAAVATAIVLLSRSDGATASTETATTSGVGVAAPPAPQVTPTPAPPPPAPEAQAMIAAAEPSAPPPVVTVPTFTHEVFNTVVDSEEPWLNLRTSRNAKSSVIARMRDGTPLRVIDPTGTWWEVEVADGADKGKHGFAHQRWIRSVR